MNTTISLPGDASLLLQAGFVGLSLVMTAGFGWWTGRWRVAFLWLLTTGVLASSGAFVGFVPPRVLFALVPALIWVTRTAIRDGWWKRSLALLVGYHDQRGTLRYAGKVGTGYDEQTLRDLRRRMDALAQKENPFADPVREKGAHWIRPEPVVQVGFSEWTPDGMLRHPRYRGERADKPAREVVRETS